MRFAEFHIFGFKRANASKRIGVRVAPEQDYVTPGCGGKGEGLGRPRFVICRHRHRHHRMQLFAIFWHNSQWHNSLRHNSLWHNPLWHNFLRHSPLWRTHSLWHNSVWHNSLWHNSLWHNSECLAGLGCVLSADIFAKHIIPRAQETMLDVTEQSRFPLRQKYVLS